MKINLNIPNRIGIIVPELMDIVNYEYMQPRIEIGKPNVINAKGIEQKQHEANYNKTGTNYHHQ